MLDVLASQRPHRNRRDLRSCRGTGGTCGDRKIVRRPQRMLQTHHHFRTVSSFTQNFKHHGFTKSITRTPALMNKMHMVAHHIVAHPPLLIIAAWVDLMLIPSSCVLCFNTTIFHASLPCDEDVDCFQRFREKPLPGCLLLSHTRYRYWTLLRRGHNTIASSTKPVASWYSRDPFLVYGQGIALTDACFTGATISFHYYHATSLFARLSLLRLLCCTTCKSCWYYISCQAVRLTFMLGFGPRTQGILAAHGCIIASQKIW